MSAAETQALPLFTSLPPRMTRRDKDGAEIGERYAEACLDSWISSGFRPVTINSKSEDPSPLRLRRNVETLVLGHDAQDRHGRPLPYLKDMLDGIRRFGKGVVALTNADILLRLSPEDRDRVRSLRRGECIVMSRLDIDSVGDVQGKEYRPGYDFLVFHAEDLPDLQSCDLVFGLPWWDHFLPLWFFFNGMKRVNLRNGCVAHLKHDERWDWEKWSDLGKRVVPTLEGSLPDDVRQTRQWELYFNKSKGAWLPSRLRSIPSFYLRQITESGRKRNHTTSLRRLSDLNVEAISGWGTQGPDQAAQSALLRV